MQYTMPTNTSSAPGVQPAARGDFRDRMAAQYLARALPSMSEEERFAFEERVAICTFDANLAEIDAVRVALNDFVTQRARSQQ